MSKTERKLIDKMAEREAAREKLLELRRSIAQKSHEAMRLESEVQELKHAAKREQARLVELTSECGALLHADLAGVTGGEAQVGDGRAVAARSA